MEKQKTTSVRTLRGKLFGFFVLCMVMGIALGIAPNAAHAQTAPPAGEEIENQANATYLDNNGNPRTAQSNTVTTVVQQVAAVAITDGITKNVSPGGQVTFNHTITNNGNGDDTFDLSVVLTSTEFTFDDVEIFEAGDVGGTDLNGGATPTISAGQTLDIVVRASIPNGALDGQSETITITATSVFDSNESAMTAVPDTALVEEGAVISVTKDYLDDTGAVTTGGDVGETVTVRFQFSNTGNADATNITLSDALPAGFDYDENSAIYLSTAQTDGSDGDGYAFDGGDPGNVTLSAGTLASGATAELTFDVVIKAGTEGQVIPNTGSYNHDDISATNTNTANYTVNERYDIATADNQDGTDDDMSIRGPVDQGAIVDFVNRFENTGTASDSYEIVLTDQANYPTGTTFTLYRTNGSGTVTTQINANGSGDFIIGPIAEGAEFEVVVRADLPSGVSKSTASDLIKTLTSVNDPTKSASFTDRLTAITANIVDVTNDAAFDSGTPAAGQGVNATGEASAVTTNTTDPNTTTSFTLFINNRSGVSDTYNLAASGSGDFSTALPAGWSVEFQDSGGTPLAGNSTGSIPSNGSIEVTAVVTVPSNATPGDQSVFFRAQSSSGALDVKHDEVTVNAVRSITLVTDQSDDVVPGGDVIYIHTLTNTGNVVENDGGASPSTALQVNLTHTQASGFQSVVFYDVNGNGTIEPGTDTQITGAGGTVALPGGTLASGATRQLLVRVSAGSGVADGTVNNTTLTVQGTGVTNVSNTDNTEVVAGSIELVKSQSTSSTGTFVTTDINADPGGTVYYRIEVSNNGSASVTDVEVTDVVPAFTTMNGDVTYTPVSGPVETTSSGTSASVSAPADGGTGTITVDVGTLAQGESVTIEFAVTIDG